jgi:hypothetical protein
MKIDSSNGYTDDYEAQAVGGGMAESSFLEDYETVSLSRLRNDVLSSAPTDSFTLPLREILLPITHANVSQSFNLHLKLCPDIT